MDNKTDDEIADLVEAVYKNPDKNFGHFKGGLKEAVRRLRGNTDRQLRDALTVALQGLGQLSKSRENKSNRPSNRQLVKSAEQTIIRVTRVLNGQETRTSDNDKVSLVTPRNHIEEKRHD